jgi:hypothetical protein
MSQGEDHRLQVLARIAPTGRKSIAKVGDRFELVEHTYSMEYLSDPPESEPYEIVVEDAAELASSTSANEWLTIAQASRLSGIPEILLFILSVIGVIKTQRRGRRRLVSWRSVLSYTEGRKARA